MVRQQEIFTELYWIEARAFQVAQKRAKAEWKLRVEANDEIPESN